MVFSPRFTGKGAGFPHAGRGLVLALLLSPLGPGIVKAAVTAPKSPPWQDVEIGLPDAAGGHAEAEGLTVTGGGLGQVAGKDQLHFTYRTVLAGDVEIIARVTDLEGDPGKASAGLMLRTGADDSAVSAAVGLNAGADGLGFFMRSIKPASPYRSASFSWGTNIQLPVWLKLCRVGKEFGAYRSVDGKIWSPVHNVSGDEFLTTEPFEVGFFAYGGEKGVPAKATFDHISIEKPTLPFESSWVGNTYGQISNGHVSGSTSTLWVQPDGTCFTNSPYDEGGQSSKIYRDGRVVKGFREENDPLGNSSAGEGSITSDGQDVVLASVRELYLTDMLAHHEATKPIYMAHDLWDPDRRMNTTTGLAITGGHLYVSDSRDSLILVADLTHPEYYTATNSTVNLTSHPIDTAGVANAAPEAIYQSQRECDNLPYKIPGLDPSAVYTVRRHFAEYTETRPGRRLVQINAGGVTALVDVVAPLGGAPFKAVVKDLPGAKPDKDDNMNVDFVRLRGGDGHEVVCGFEILKTDGSRSFALNCGGPAADGFASEVNELPDRDFAFTRPGPMTVDSHGDLWIIRHPDPSGADGGILCYRPDGKPAGQHITSIANPAALAFDGRTGRLLVADGGLDNNIKAFINLDQTPGLDTSFGNQGSFGIPGGIFAGPHPGLLSDPQAGGDARFYGLTGVGADAKGNLYVSCNSSGTDFRSYAPDGHMLWQLCGLNFVDCMDFDPDSDGTEVLGPFKHYHMDYSGNQPGGEWHYVAYNWNAAKYGPPPRQGGSSGVVRRLGPGHQRILFSSGQGSVDYIGIFRYDGEIAIPCGSITPNKNHGVDVWIDANGDGQQTPDEVTSSPFPGWFQSFDVDRNGDIWMASMASPTLHHFKFLGLSAAGVPQYDAKPGDVEDIPFPGNGQKVSMWGRLARVSYDSDRDIMYLEGPAKTRESPKSDPVVYLARYDNWSQGNRTAKWLITLPEPDSDPNFIYPGTTRPSGLAHQWQAMAAAGDRVFVSSLWGSINVYRASDGTLDTILVPGPEVSGRNAWQDEQMGVRAIQRKDGEYEVLEENSGFDAKLNLFRYRTAPGD